MRPDTRTAAAPVGLAVNLTVPQNPDPDGLAPADVKDVSVKLPAGMAISASAAEGLGACTDAQIALKSLAPATCPDSAKIGTVEVTTPLLDDPLHGSVFLGSPLEQSPQAAAQGRMYRLFLEIEGSGVRIKLPGSVVPDPTTGQLTATFRDNPRLPFEALNVQLRGGPRAPLTTPRSCGTYTTVSELTSWARPEEPVTARSTFTIDEGCAGAGQFTPSLEAGTTSPVAGGFSPFTLRVTSPQGQQNLSRIQTTLPEGVLAKLKGVAVCGDAEAATGNCPAASQVGTTTVGAGDGSPLYIPQPGRPATAVYLAGAYQGAPYSLVVKVPAQAGPFDLGTVSVRNALFVDPATTQVTAKSDPLPQILDGVPVTYRDVRVELTRSDFTLNPTSCEPMKVTSLLTSSAGATAAPSDRFQVGECASLGFKPSVELAVKGNTKRIGDPALTATIDYPKGGSYANIAKTTVLLPKTEFIDNRHINGPCTRVQFAAGACPKSSILGTATAYSPLLGQPLTGPVYFRSNGGERELPDMVVDLNGQIHVTLVGFIDSVGKKGSEKRRTRTRFLSVPDAPVSKFVLNLYGGKRGLIQNSVDLCRHPGQATVQMEAQNGSSRNFDTPFAAQCGKKKSKHKGAAKQR